MTDSPGGLDATRYFWDIDPKDDSAHSRVLRRVGSGRTVLELGPGPGHMTRHLTAAGNTVTCVEMDPAAAKEAEQHAAAVAVADLDVVDLHDVVGDARFDVVIAADVLEHLRRPDRTLRQCAELLAPGGVALLSIPNVAHVDVRLALLAGRWDYKRDGLLDLTHVRFFTRDAVLRLVRAAGLQIDAMETVRWPAFTTNLGASPTDVPAEVLDRMLAEPDAETLQFVVQCSVPATGLAERPSDEALLDAALCTPGDYRPTPPPRPAPATPTPPPSGRWARLRAKVGR